VFKSVFSRMLVTYLLIIAFILMLESIVLAQLYRNDYYNLHRQEIVKKAEDVSEMYTYMLEKNQYVSGIMGILQTNYFYDILEIMEGSESLVWIVGRYGDYEVVVENGIIRRTLTEEEQDKYLKQVLDGGILADENIFQSKFSNPILTVGVPIYGFRVLDDGSREIIGAVFLHTRLNFIQTATYRLYRQMGISIIIAVSIGIMLVILTSSRISAPLKEMSKLTRAIAKGNFDKRVDVDSNDELGALGEDFNHMADELMRQEQLRSGFVANVSHELRSPLTSIHGFAQGILDGTIKPEDKDKYLQIIVDETGRLSKLIRELLDLSQYESGKFPLNIKSFDINELCRRVLIRYIDMIEEKGINLEVQFKQEFSYVLADADRIEQVLINLLDNAIKFTPSEGTIKLWTHNAKGNVIVGITDTGCGIPAEDLDYIFERFYKVDKSHTDKMGTGLGLSIVKMILDQHGENITVNSSVGKGTSFTFTLRSDGKKNDKS